MCWGVNLHDLQKCFSNNNLDILTFVSVHIRKLCTPLLQSACSEIFLYRVSTAIGYSSGTDHPHAQCTEPVCFQSRPSSVATLNHVWPPSMWPQWLRTSVLVHTSILLAIHLIFNNTVLALYHSTFPICVCATLYCSFYHQTGACHCYHQASWQRKIWRGWGRVSADIFGWVPDYRLFQ